MKLATLHDLYVEELKGLFSAEHQVLDVLPRIAKAAFHAQLSKTFTEHLTQTKGHVDRLEQIFQRLNTSPKGQTCKAMEGLLEAGKQIVAADADPSVKDAALLAAAQRVEHYEMAVYGCVRTYARLLGYNQDADLLQKTLDEEGAANEALMDLAHRTINVEAVTPVAINLARQHQNDHSTTIR